MKKAEIGKKGNVYQRTSQQKTKESRGRKLLNTSSSMDCLPGSSTKEIKQRKASTPTHDRTALSNSPDISCINSNDAKSLCSRSTISSGKTNVKNFPKPAVQKDSKLQDQLDMKYILNLQAAFRNELVKARCSKIDSELTSIQQKIVENENMLKKTTERLKNISFNKEIDRLHKLHNPAHGQILETVDSTNCDEYLSKLNTKIEQTQNQLKIKNIEPPQGGGAQLMEVISDTLAAFEKLKTDHDVETPKVLKEMKDINKNTINALTRGKDNLSTCEDVLLNRAALEISSLQDR